MKATILKALFIAPFVGWAAWVNASEPMIWATPSGQPALALRVEPQERLAANALRSGAEAPR